MNSSLDERRDVVICGGGLAGLLLARQLSRELPDLSVTVIEKARRPLPDACHKVGESSVEVGSQYLERLGLETYLLDRHLVKYGLRFFPGHGELPLHERTEIGPCAEPIVRSYQLDRGRFEGDVMAMLESDGVELVEAGTVQAVEMAEGEGDHCVRYVTERGEHARQARWVVDATGRAALLRRRLKLSRGTRHPASSGWFRIRGDFDINTMVAPEHEGWHARVGNEHRWRSTNHFMGPGYWAWVIPLSTGHTSIGLVVHEETHDFAHVQSLAAVQAFLAEHEPHLAAALAPFEVADFACIRHYNNLAARTWSADRWAIVGVAGAFVDPLYSPGTDFIAFSNSFTTSLIRSDTEGHDIDDMTRALNGQYRAFVAATTEIFRTAAPVYGHVQAMSMKLYWDNFVYWSYMAQYFQQECWTWHADVRSRIDAEGQTFMELSGFMHKLLRAYAELAPSVPHQVMLALPNFPSVLVDAHIATGQRMEQAEALDYVVMRADEARQIAIEFVLRVIQTVDTETATRILERSDFTQWTLEIPEERIVTAGLDSLARRRRLSPIAKDVDRTLGRLRRHADAKVNRALLVSNAQSTS